MTLRIRIFLSILLVSLTTLFVSTGYLINKNHMENINREQERSLNDFDFIKSSISNNLDATTTSEDTLKTVISRYGEYYAQRSIHILLYRNNQYLQYDFQITDQSIYDSLLMVEEKTKMVQILKLNSHHTIIISGLLWENDNGVLLYARDISAIYQARSRNIWLSLLLAFGLIIILSFLSFLYSKWLTKPIELLQKGAVAVSRGEYDVRINETKDEFNDLGNAFNTMASAIESRTLELEEKAKELQIFIDDLSHEMNTPLTSIQGYAEFLQSANATYEQQQHAAAIIRNEARRMKDIYTKLMTLTFAREHKIELTEVNYQNLIQQVKDTFSNLLTERNITLISESSLFTLKIDQTLIYMLLSNLVKNSIQATSNGGSIIIQAYEEDNNPVIEVADYGYGIPEDKIKDVTKPFVRVDKSRSRKTGGAGLGLSICKSIAILHDAELIIESQVGKGTTVKLKFNS